MRIQLLGNALDDLNEENKVIKIGSMEKISGGG